MARRPRDSLDLTGKVVVVTGAAQGLGEAIAVTLGGLGARLLLLDSQEAQVREVAARLGDGGREAAAMGCDVTDESQVAACAEALAKTHGRCDGLVNNAGAIGRAPLEYIGLEPWERLIAINVTGPLLCMKHFGALMLRQGSGSIVTVTSIAGVLPVPGGGAYSPSKAAADMLARQAAVEWGPRGIRSNIVAPGAMRTPMTRASNDDPKLAAERARRIPLGRIPGPEETASAVAFLISDASAYLNGARLEVDGGLVQAGLGQVPRAPS
jgi:NAD(P)-dependent dehydrogenase (short-subunit alcohol dehydrogenase family)